MRSVVRVKSSTVIKCGTLNGTTSLNLSTCLDTEEMEAHGFMFEMKFSCVDISQIFNTDLCISDISGDLVQKELCCVFPLTSSLIGCSRTKLSLNLGMKSYYLLTSRHCFLLRMITDTPCG